MDQQKIDEYKVRLEKERSLILSEITNNEKPSSFGADAEDMDEWTDKSEALGDQLAVADGLKTRLADIDLALQKIRMGKYGVCEKCGKPIEKEVLDIDPESRLCKNDKAGK